MVVIFKVAVQVADGLFVSVEVTLAVCAILPVSVDTAAVVRVATNVRVIAEVAAVMETVAAVGAGSIVPAANIVTENDERLSCACVVPTRGSTGAIRNWGQGP